MEKSIISRNISKKYKLYSGSKDRILDLLLPKSVGEDFYALSNITFEANKGDVIGFVGINGSGKSTLSNIIAGVVPATSGEIETSGQASLIAVSSGLKGDLSGRDNIELKLLMLGFNKKEIIELEPLIIEFAELEKFIDQPVKSYSSGMKSRLGFAISVNVDPDILIIDEALSVGDKAFASKSFNKMMEFKEKGKTMIFVSHSISQMKKFCEKILWLEFGKIRDYGSVEDILPKYEQFLTTWENLDKHSREKYRNKIVNEDPKFELESLTPLNQSTNYTEQLTSFLAHIKKGDSFLYSSPLDTQNKTKSKNYKNYVYYVKKRAEYNNEVYYLLSECPSALNGTIGWMKKSSVSLLTHLLIDEDCKEFIIQGKGSAFSKPWGGERDKVIDDLIAYKDHIFNVDRTEKVGKNIWYRGTLSNDHVWIHSKFLLNKNEESLEKRLHE